MNRKLKDRNQYDEFLHKIQQLKMKELWENEKDEFWQSIKDTKPPSF